MYETTLRFSRNGWLACVALVASSRGCSSGQTHTTSPVANASQCRPTPPRPMPPDACYGGQPAQPATGPWMQRVDGRGVVSAGPAMAACQTASTTPEKVVYHGHFDLPDESWAFGLSGLHYDPTSKDFLAVRDNKEMVAGQPQGPFLVTLRPDETLLHWTGELRTTPLGPFDHFEGITRMGGRVFLTTDGDTTEGGTEEIAHLVESTPTGTVRVPDLLPASMMKTSHNSGIEALTTAPDGVTLFAASERPSRGNDACESFVRIAKMQVGRPTTLYRYQLNTDASGVDVGVSAMVALSNSRLLFLERGFTDGVGNAVRLFQVDLVEPRGQGTDGTTVKTLLLDLATLPRDEFRAHPDSRQCAHAGMGNYEGMTLGPCLADGTRSLVLVSDNNWDRDPKHVQIRRIVLLGLQSGRSL